MLVSVVNKFGHKIGEQVITDPALEVLFPGQPVIIIDWMYDNTRPTAEELSKPVLYQGVEYSGSYGWGSSVKSGKTIGLTEDIPGRVIGVGQKCHYVGAWLLANAFWGSHYGPIKVKVAKVGSIIAGKVIGDGHGLISRELFAKTVCSAPIELTTSRSSYTFAQRLPVSALDEWREEIEDTALEADLLEYAEGATWDEKRELVSLDAEMKEHPFITNALARSAGRMFADMARSLPVQPEYRVIVPGQTSTVCMPSMQGKVVINAQPIDAWGSIRAIELDNSHQENIPSELVQYRLSTKRAFAKGTASVVDDLDGYDMIISDKDTKFGKIQGVVYLSFTAYWKDCIVAVNPELAEAMGRDFDGDALQIMSANDRPMTYQAVLDFPTQASPKLRKINVPLDQRVRMIGQSMSNLVGFATNVVADTFMVQDQQAMAELAGFTTRDVYGPEFHDTQVETMDSFRYMSIKIGTDGFKTDVDMTAAEKSIGIVQGNIKKGFGANAPWTNWPGDWAFSHGVPVFVKDKEHFDTLSPEEKKCSVYWWMDGTVAQIAKVALPLLGAKVAEPIKMRPLTTYGQWAIQDKNLEDKARQVYMMYLAQSAKTNWTDGTDIARLKKEVRAYADMVFNGVEPWYAANALWCYAHGLRSKNAGAGCVFMTYPDEAKRIIVEKPGRSTKIIILNGLSYQLPDVNDLETEVEIIDLNLLVNGRFIVRKAVVGAVIGQIQPRDKRYPQSMIGLIAENSDQPKSGKYHAVIKKYGEKSHSISLA